MKNCPMSRARGSTLVFKCASPGPASYLGS
ncbi:MAG: hypothetical protein ACI80K_001938, partial [Paracoccaceae bacterium]